MVKRNPAAILLCCLLSLAMLLAPRDAAAVPPQDILIVHSYHQGFHWTDNIMAGMLAVLQKEAPDAQVHVEYLDAKRYPLETFGPILIETLSRKTSRLKPKVILVSDDAAFDLMLSLRNELFPGVPLVFCGVNNFKDERLAGQMEVTGVVEDFDIKSTIDVILSLHRQTTHLAVISDSTETGAINLERFRQVAPVFADRLKFLELYELSTEELLGKLAKLPPESIILNLSFFRDRLGQSYSTQDGNKLIAAHAGRAIYSCWDYFLVGDVVGGYMTSGRQQGEEAASMVAAILKGIRANDIPIIRTSPNTYMFDYKVMERFGIKRSALPNGSVVLNSQVSMLEQYWGWLLGVALFCGLQTFLILTLLTRGKRLHAANAALGESEHFTRSLLETIPVPVFYKGRDGRYQGFNKAFLNFYGKSKDELIGKPVFDITSPDMAKVYHAHDMELFENPGTQIYPYKVKTSQGDVRDVIFHKASLTDEHGSVTGLIGALLDVTELKLMERQNIVLVDIIKRSKDFIGVADIKKKAFFVNPAGQILVGLDDDDTVAKTKIEEYFLTEDFPFFENTILPAVMKEGRWAGEFRFRHFKTGKPVPVLYELFLTEDPETGASTNFATISRDITERKQAEEVRGELQAQLLQAQKMESVGRLAGGVAHDFNNMLGVIFGHTEIALEDVDPETPLHASLQAVHHAAERSAALTRQLLAFARKQTVDPKVININDTVEGMLNMLRRLIGEDIDLVWRPGADLPPVKVDPSQVDQVLANLCVNARDAIAGHGKIIIETDKITFDAVYCADHLEFLPGEYLLLAVSDDGCGIDKKTLNHIFEPFFTTKEQGKGTGLGLASVFGMVKQNNGFIHVDSELGQGTTFKIYLPKYAVKSTDETKKAEEMSTERGHETILLVEDESAILNMTTMMLERLGYSVVAAATPGEAIRLAHEYLGKIDLLMTDVVMPEMNGRDLAGNLLSHYPNLKRLFMSGYTADIIAHHGVLNEDVHFIQKPFSMKELGGKLREALEG